MTKKDYIAIANAIVSSRNLAVLNGENDITVSNTVGYIIDALSVVFENDNSNFDRHKFIHYIQTH